MYSTVFNKACQLLGYDTDTCDSRLPMSLQSIFDHGISTLKRIPKELMLMWVAVSENTSDLPLKGAACSDVQIPNLPGINITSVVTKERMYYTIADPLPFQPNGLSEQNFCDVEIFINHIGVDDSVKITIWLPLTNWNGRFQATGGCGFAMSCSRSITGPAIMQGYATASTDGGHEPISGSCSSWALREEEDGSINWPLWTNFASRSLHDMTLIGKAVTENFYGQPPRYSYFNGCSTGGRQGLMNAQRYPTDYDGINANAPAIYWPRLLPALQWPHIVMQESQTFLSDCEADFFVDASISACDAQDGIVDGVIEDWTNCHFDPHDLVGQTIPCEAEDDDSRGSRTNKTVTTTMADIIQKIWDGPRTTTSNGDSGSFLWYGLTRGASLSALAGSRPFPISNTWIKHFLLRNPTFDTSVLKPADMESLFATSIAEYEATIGTNDPDLSAFAASGGKMITWHGVSDDRIPPNGTLRYRDAVNDVMGGDGIVDGFWRVFLVPGVDHCGGGKGPSPVDSMVELVRWVEDGVAPEVLRAEGVDGLGRVVRRGICRWPLRSRWDGVGDVTVEGSFRCE